MWIAPVIDRTQTDVDFAREHRNDAEDHKGAQNSVDWERLTRNLSHISDFLFGLGYQSARVWRATWPKGYIPQEKEISQIAESLFAIRYNLYNFTGITWKEWEGKTWRELDIGERFAADFFSSFVVPPLPFTHFEKINDLEEWTLILERILNQFKNCFIACGTVVSGQAISFPQFIQPLDCRMTWADWDAINRTWGKIEKEDRPATLLFNRCFDPAQQMTWEEWNTLNRTWKEVDQEGRIAADYFRRK